mgnify:CR=1 FL=1
MQLNKDFNHSYWETNFLKTEFDLIIIGAGIVGLSTALSFHQKNKKAKILVLERGILPNGASTKNAGFACFGSAGELLDDLARGDENTVWETVHMRWKGLQLLRKRIGDKHLDYKPYGGYELFTETNAFESCRDSLPDLNTNIKSLIGLPNCFIISKKYQRQFSTSKGMVLNQYEGQLDTGKMMQALLSQVLQAGILVLNGIAVEALSDLSAGALVHSSAGTWHARMVVVATNGFATQLLKIKDVKPARAQVLITKPLPQLRIKGAFHFDRGYFYFRNIHQRILFGGGRQLDFKGETTFDQGLHPLIQNELEHLLRTTLLPGIPLQIEQRWSGIMGVGAEKKPIIRAVSKHIIAAVRMGGMGVAIGSLVGEETARVLSD